VKSGKAIAIAVTTPQRARGLPDVPTIAESGVPGFDITVTYGFFVPSATPKTIVNRLNAHIVEILKQPEIVERLSAFGLEARGSTPEEFSAVVRDEVALWANVVKTAMLRIE
jgi:tripartite-type tricarboxylate transporter receptor subunit TctC